jgi:ribosomal protein S18 acetylase RimI-like enzyme
MKTVQLTLEHLDYCAKHRAECYNEELGRSKAKLRKKIVKARIKILMPGAGYVILREDYDDPQYAHISSILVERGKQRQGYGSQLLKLAEQETLKNGFNGVTLSVRPDAEGKVHKFYLKNGYKKYLQDKGRTRYIKKLK